MLQFATSSFFIVILGLLTIPLNCNIFYTLTSFDFSARVLISSYRHATVILVIVKFVNTLIYLIPFLKKIYKNISLLIKKKMIILYNIYFLAALNIFNALSVFYYCRVTCTGGCGVGLNDKVGDSFVICLAGNTPKLPVPVRILVVHISITL